MRKNMTLLTCLQNNTFLSLLIAIISFQNRGNFTCNTGVVLVGLPYIYIPCRFSVFKADYCVNGTSILQNAKYLEHLMMITKLIPFLCC